MKTFIFKFTVVYYLILNYFNYQEVERFSLMYFLLVIPISIFVAAFSPFLFFRYNRRTIALTTLLALTAVVAIVRSDYWTLVSAVLIFSTIIVIINGGLQIDLKFINQLFLLSLAGCVISHHLGINEFGYIPRIGNLAEAEAQGLGVRISLFPLTPESAFFSLFVIAYNYYFNKTRTRYFYFVVAGYFLVFSASRTAIAILVFFMMFEFASRIITFRYRLFYLLLNAGFVVMFIVISNLKTFHLWISKSDNEILKSIILRTEKNITQSSDVHDVATRIWIWQQHFKILSYNPLFGVGTYNFGDYVPNKTKVYHFTSGSESFLTSWMARIGMPIILLVAFLVMSQNAALRERSKFGYAMTLLLLLVMISYGSFIVPYNFLFLLLCASLPDTSKSINLESRESLAPIH